MSKQNQNTNGARFDRLLQYLADSEGNDIEIAALHQLLETLWQLLTPEQETEFFDQAVALEAKAARWAGNDSCSRQLPASNRHDTLVMACKCLLEAFRETGDLNDLPVSQVIGMLSKALRQRPRSMADHFIAINAAQIAFSLDRDFALPPARLEEIVGAASTLEAIESTPGFTWEAQATDWESVCARIADTVGLGPQRGWDRHIRQLLSPSKRRGTGRSP